MSETPPPISDESAAGSTTNPIGQSINDGKGRIFPCDTCGSDMVFNIGKQLMSCQYCGFEKEISLDEEDSIQEQDYHAMLVHMEEVKEKSESQDSEVSKTDQSPEANELHCESCGATVVFLGSLTSSECPYCASPIQRDDVHKAENRIPVDGVLPFKITKEKAKSNLVNWVNSRWFAPSQFLKQGAEGKFNGVYLPYWTIDSMTATQYSGQRGEHYYVTVGTGKNRRQVRKTSWWPASGFFQRFFDDVTVMASHDLPQDLVVGLEPWPLHLCIPMSQQVLAGFLARTYETTLEQGFSEAKIRIDQAIESDVRRRIGGDEQQIDSIQSRYDAITFKHLLLPLWLMVYRYNDKVYQVLINAGTGEVQGHRPYSWVKILFASLGVVAFTILVFALTQA